jgi:hypothetical protein
MNQSLSNNTKRDKHNVLIIPSGLKQSIKLNIKALVVLVVLILYFGASPKQLYAQQADVSLQLFYDQLSPYGQWIDYPKYGYVWIPDAGQDFVPYSTNGHWVMTDDGWTWASDYEWGWAPFHYGRWDYDDSYGWLWVPGTEWGPSWVDWRSADGYYGWSPMEPGISLSVGFGRPYNSNYDHWNFVRSGDFDRTDINRYYVNRTDHDRLVRSSIVINKTYVDNSRHSTYAFGPAREDVQRATGRTINRVAIQENSKPGQSMRNGQLSMYRPKMTTNNARGQKPVPVKIANLKDVKHPSGGNVTNQAVKVTPANNNSKKAQPSQARVNPQNSTNKVQPTQARVVKPSGNNAVNQKSSTTSKVQATQPRKVNPTVNKNVNTQNTSKSASPAQPRKVNPTVNRTANPQNNANKAQPAQQQRTANPANSISKQQPQQQQRPQQQPKQQQQRPQQQPKQQQQQPQQQQPKNESPQNNRNEQQKDSKP